MRILCGRMVAMVNDLSAQNAMEEVNAMDISDSNAPREDWNSDAVGMVIRELETAAAENNDCPGWVAAISAVTGMSYDDAYLTFGDAVTDDEGNAPRLIDIAAHLRMLDEEPSERDMEATPCVGEGEE